MLNITRLAILAPGLLGGSLAQAKKDTLEVRIWGRNAEKIKPLESEGYALVSTDLSEVISGADLIVLAMPVPYMEEMVAALKEAGLKKEQLITDVGSVKSSVINDLQPLLGAEGYTFIGSHPMAGSEATGYSAASPTLFSDAACILTPDEFTSPENLALLESFWKSVGALTHFLSPEDHDEVISRVSHMPHILAAVCSHVALKPSSNGAYAGNGLKDTSRVASGDPHMWEGIISENKEAILPHLEEAILRLKQYKAAISAENTDELTRLLTEDKVARDGFYA